MSNSILYVEDEPDDIFFMQRAFKKIAPSIDLRVITDGQEAADFFTSGEGSKTANPSLALVILDVNLPGQSGLQILSHIRTRSKYRTVPVLLFSASSQQSDIDSGYERGCNAYLVKPSDQDRLKELVATIHDFWLKENKYSISATGVAFFSGEGLNPTSTG